MEKQVLKRRREGDNFPAPPHTSIGSRERESLRDRRQSLGMKFLPLGSTFNALLGDYVCPPTTFFSPTLLAASRESGKQSGRLENVILLTEEGKNTLCSRTPAVHSPHFIFQRPNSREERDGVVVGRLKSKTPALLDPPASISCQSQFTWACLPSRSPSRLLR